MTTEVGTITTGSDGHGTIKGLSSGTYYLKETTAPAGYKIDNTAIPVTIDETTDYTEIDATDDAQTLLPVTGGVGTYIFIALGALIVIGTLLIVIKNKKKNGQEK